MLFRVGASYRRIKLYHCYFRRAPRISRISDIFIQGLWADIEKLKRILKIN